MASKNLDSDTTSKREFIQPILIFVGILVFTILVIQLISVGVDKLRQKLGLPIQVNNTTITVPTTTPDSSPVQAQSEFPDFLQLSTMKKLPVIQNFESWTPNAVLENAKVVNTMVVEKGQIAKAYVFVQASLNNSALTQWESIYLKFNNLGGHLFRPQSLPVPPSDRTKLLFAVNDIPYLPGTPYSEQKIPKRTDWFPLFKEGSEINIVGFISSLRPAKIEEISLYYECIDGDDACEITLK